MYIPNLAIWVTYDRIWKRIHYYENPAFEEEGISRAGKIWSTITIRINYLAEMCFCFHLNFQLLKFSIRNSKKKIIHHYHHSTIWKKNEFVLLDERWISKFKKCLVCKMKIFIQFKLLHWLDSNSKKKNRIQDSSYL